MAGKAKAMEAQTRPGGLSRKLRSAPVMEGIAGYLYITPWLLGFLVFTAMPFVASLILSLTQWDLLKAPRFVGFGNYIKLISKDSLFRMGLYNTAYFVILSVPLRQIMCLSLALLLNQKLKGIAIYRTIFYLPSITAGVATAYLWAYLFNVHNGLINATLAAIGIQGPRWFLDTRWAKPALIIMSLWGGGSTMIIYLAGLQGVPTHLYEAAEVDGANLWQRFWHVTIPMITPTIFFNLIMGFIGAFHIFTAAYVITQGGPVNSTLFYMLYLYYQAFRDFKMGYAAAMAWVLFLIILAITLVQLLSARRWVHYEYEERGGRIF